MGDGVVNKAVSIVYSGYPEAYRQCLLVLRKLIFDIAKQLPEVGEIEETLKWGEPSYLTSQTKSGSTIRLAWHQSRPEQYGIYFNCKTTLVADFKERYADLFNFGGNRSILFSLEDDVPIEALSDCIAMALTYHLK